MLNRTSEALKTNSEPDLDEPLKPVSDVDLHLSAMIPSGYLPDVHQRLVLYKRISQAASHDELHDLQVEMIDRFGLLPQEVKNLFAKAELRLRTRKLGMMRMEICTAGGRIEYTDQPELHMA